MDLRLLLQIMAEKNASDLHVRSNKPAVFRVDGNLSFRTPEAIPAETVDRWVKSILNEKQMRMTGGSFSVSKLGIRLGITRMAKLTTFF